MRNVIIEYPSVNNIHGSHLIYSPKHNSIQFSNHIEEIEPLNLYFEIRESQHYFPELHKSYFSYADLKEACKKQQGRWFNRENFLWISFGVMINNQFVKICNENQVVIEKAGLKPFKFSFDYKLHNLPIILQKAS